MRQSFPEGSAVWVAKCVSFAGKVFNCCDFQGGSGIKDGDALGESESGFDVVGESALPHGLHLPGLESVQGFLLVLLGEALVWVHRR